VLSSFRGPHISLKKTMIHICLIQSDGKDSSLRERKRNMKRREEEDKKKTKQSGKLSSLVEQFIT